MLHSNMLNLLILLTISVGLSSCDNAKSLEASPYVEPVALIRNVKNIKSAQVKNGQGLYQALKNVSIDNALSLEIINELRDEVEFSKLKVGDKLEAIFDHNQKLIKFSFSQNPVETHVLTFNDKTNKWDYSFDVVKTYWKPRIIEGELNAGSTLEEDLIASGLNRSSVNEVVNVLLCKVNFRMNARHGDHYKILLSERMHNKEIVETKVLFTSYSGLRAGTHEAFFYEDEEKSSTYTAHYTENGQALINSGLRYPLSRLHVRSGYGVRRHPVTGKRAMHRGVDLRARHGANVHAVAAGKVVSSTYNEYAGNKVAIKHRDGSTSFYYHLSKRGVNVGDWVRSHQVIGKVGATGRVTGAHLHFGFKKPNGKWMNPLNKRMIATPKLTGQRFEKLTTQINSIKGLLADLKISKNAKYLVANLQNIRRYPSSFDNLDNFVKVIE